MVSGSIYELGHILDYIPGLGICPVDQRFWKAWAEDLRCLILLVICKSSGTHLVSTKLTGITLLSGDLSHSRGRAGQHPTLSCR